MIYGLTFATENMSKAADLCRKSAYMNGVDSFAVYRESHLNHEFMLLNKDIFAQPRGFGYWLWKPYLIYKDLLNMAENDILIYSDAGVEFINNVSHIIEKMDQDIFLFGNNWNHVDWCKGDAIQTINGDLFDLKAGGFVNGVQMSHSIKQCQASVIFIRNTEWSRKFVKEWLLYCQMPGLIDDSPSVTPNYPTFQEHRHDQAILTCLAIKYGIKRHWWPASYSNGAFTYDKLPCYESDNYPVIFHHHRRRNEEF